MKGFVILVVLGSLGIVLSFVVMGLVTFQLPRQLVRERTRVAGMNFAPVVVASIEPVDLRVRPLVSIDSVHVSPGDRVLLKNQVDGRENGIWIAPGDTEWERAPDLSNKDQCVEGVMVFVSQGRTQRHQTFVLRLLSPPAPLGEVDLYFLPVLQHLFGPAHLPDHQVLQVNAQGLATWNAPDVVARQTLKQMKDRGWVRTDVDVHRSAVIPNQLHFLYGFWEDHGETLPERWVPNVERWTSLNPTYPVRHWSRERAEELLRAEFPEWWEWYREARPIMRVDLLKWLLLFHEGGLVIDLDCSPAEPAVALDTLFAQWHYPRMVLLGEPGRISVYEAESLNRFPIRQDRPCVAGTQRLVTHWMASVARHPLVHFVLQHMKCYAPRVGKHDYDVTWATGDDALTEVYAHYGRDFVDIHVDSAEAVVQHERLGTWRRQKEKTTLEE